MRRMQLHNRSVQLKKRTCTSPGSMQLSESNVLSAPLTYNSIHKPGANDRISTLAEAQKSPDSKPKQDAEVSALLHFILPAFSFFLWTFPIWAPKYWGENLKNAGPLILPFERVRLYHFSLHKLCFQWAGKGSPVGSASRIKLENAQAISMSNHRWLLLSGRPQRWPYLWVSVDGAGPVKILCSGTRAPHFPPPGIVSLESPSSTFFGCGLCHRDLSGDCTKLFTQWDCLYLCSRAHPRQNHLGGTS